MGAGLAVDFIVLVVFDKEETVAEVALVVLEIGFATGRFETGTGKEGGSIATVFA